MKSYLPEGNTFYYYGYCEANLTNFFLRYVAPGMVCIDVGAHVGFYTMLFAQLVGREGRVLAFEPTPWTHALLRENASELPGVSLFQKAVSSTSKEITLADYGPGYGAYNSAHAAGAADLTKESREVQAGAVVLDEQVEALGLRPDIIKIDAEGFEYEVLQGMATIVSTGGSRPIISIEVAGGEAWAQGRNQALHFLEEKEYQLFSISTEGLLISHSIQLEYGYDNLIAVPKEKLPSMAEYRHDRY